MIDDGGSNKVEQTSNNKTLSEESQSPLRSLALRGSHRLYFWNLSSVIRSPTIHVVLMISTFTGSQ